MTSEQSSKGRLTLFLSYADGVGKAHAMLDAARRAQAEGYSVAVGCADTYPPELLEGLECLPVKRIEFSDAVRVEIDIDAILARRPQIVVVGNLAHTDMPGLRHPRRYQDVEELLENGIGVYAALNISSLESLNDIVEQITGTRVRDTVPDRLINETAAIELVDLDPDSLLKRVESGAFHPPETLPENFYRKGNLMALRELCLGWAARRIDRQVRSYMRSRSIAGPWPAAERLMVCISSHPLSERLVRTGRRLADGLNAEWFVVYVETPERLSFSAPHRERMTRALRLAEELGAQVTSISGRTVPEAVVTYAREHNITKIIVGRPLRPRWLEFINGSIVDEIIRQSQNIDVYVISDESGPVQKGIPEGWRPHSPWRRYLEATAMVALVTLIGFPIHLVLDPTNLVMIFLLAVVACAMFLGRGPSLLASLLSALSFDFFFTDPRLSLSISDTQYLLTFVGLLGVSLVISNLAGLLRGQVEASQRREAQTAALYALSRELTISLDLPAVLQAVIRHVSQTLSRDVVILLPAKDRLEVSAASPGFELEEQEKQVAAWSFEHAQPAGRGTDTLPGARSRYQPMTSSQGVVGVLGVRPQQPDSYLTPDQRQMLEADSSLAALAIERARMAEQASRAEILAAAERLQTALLNSISHDLRTPLASITGVFSSLHEAEEAGGQEAGGEEAGGKEAGGKDAVGGGPVAETVVMDRGTRLELLETGWEEAERLNRLVGNLLDMTRLESGAMRLRKVEGDIEEVTGAALARLKNRRQDHPVHTHLPATLPLVPMDVVLIEQVMVNLLDNALKYSPPGGSIEIQVEAREPELEVSVMDEGRGIPPEDLQRVFDKFFRVQRRIQGGDQVSGTGLGLSICRGIIEAHGGRIWAANRPTGGAQITFTLPFSARGQ